MNIQFNCKSCGHKYSVKPKYAGRTAKCKECGARITVPIYTEKRNNMNSLSPQKGEVFCRQCGTSMKKKSKSEGRNKMKKYLSHILVAVIAVTIGYFAGREHIKYEIRSAFSDAAENFGKSLESTFGEGTSDTERGSTTKESKVSAQKDDSEAMEYIANSLELYDLEAEYKDSFIDENVPGVLFKLRNSGERTLSEVEVTVYFKDVDGNVISEEDYHPVLVSEYSFSGDNKPLKPGYIWQMEKGKFYKAKNVPDEWEEGNVEASITNIEFAE